MASPLRDERGSALVAAMMLLLVMLGIGLSVVALGDTQDRMATGERVRESSFGLAEATLEAQVARLGRAWPASATTAFPVECTPAAANLTRCPDATTLAAAVGSVDHGGAACADGAPVWRSTVRDNGSTIGSFYRTTVAATQPSYDANDDGLLWVRAEGRARCKLRTLVTLVRANQVTLTFPRLTIAANWFWTNNQGRKVIVDTVGSYAQPPSIRPPAGSAAAPVQVRCSGATPSPCLKYEEGKGQIGGSTPTQADIPTSTLTDEQAGMLKAQARTLGTYFAAGSCPATLNGPLVYVEDINPCPDYAGGNTAAEPGMLVVGRGTLQFGGNRIFYGLIYSRNEDDSTAAVIETRGASAIQGAVAVDGPGGVIAGASSTNVVFDARAFSLAKALADASPVPGSWRELSPTE